MGPELGLRPDSLTDVREGERETRSRIVGIARNDVRMEVRKRVAEGLVVHLDRTEVRLKRSPCVEYIKPIRGRLLRRQFRGFCDVRPRPDNHGVPRLDRRPLQVCVGHRALQESETKASALRPILAAHRAPVAPAQVIERLRPAHPSIIAERLIGRRRGPGGARSHDRRAGGKPHVRNGNHSIPGV